MVSAVIFNYPDEYLERVPSAANFNHYMNASAKDADMTLKGLAPGTVIEIETLDKTHGNVMKIIKQSALHSLQQGK